MSKTEEYVAHAKTCMDVGDWKSLEWLIKGLVGGQDEALHQAQWILAAERLPEEMQPVLVFRKLIRIGYYSKGAWFDIQGYEWAHPRTHWMPLPAVPATQAEVGHEAD